MAKNLWPIVKKTIVVIILIVKTISLEIKGVLNDRNTR
jgi:hypothetical protein